MSVGRALGRTGIRSQTADDTRPYGASILVVVLTAIAVGTLATVINPDGSPEQIAAFIAAACVLARGSTWTFDTVGACASVALFGHTVGNPMFAVLAPVLSVIFLAAVIGGRVIGHHQRAPRFLAWFGALDVLAFVLSPDGADLQLEFHTPRLVISLVVTVLLGALAGFAPGLALPALGLLVPLVTIPTTSAAGGSQGVIFGAAVVFAIVYLALAFLAQLVLGRSSPSGR